MNFSEQLPFVPALLVFLIQSYLLWSWFRSRRRGDGKERKICLWGFLLGELYLLWEVLLVQQTGKPLPGSLEQKMLMVRLLLGGSIGGLFTVMGLFYLSFAFYGRSNALDGPSKSIEPRDESADSD